MDLAVSQCLLVHLLLLLLLLPLVNSPSVFNMELK